MSLHKFCNTIHPNNVKYSSHSAGEPHTFFQKYDELFAIQRRYDPLTILELGTHLGETTKVYHDYFVNANIVTIERVKSHIDYIPDKDKYPRIHFVHAELLNEGGWSSVPQFSFDLLPYKTFDIVIDDCVELPMDFANPIDQVNIQTQTFNRFYDKLNPGGMIIIDCIQQSSYVDIIKNKFVGDKSKIQFYDLRHIKDYYDNNMLVYTY